MGPAKQTSKQYLLDLILRTYKTLHIENQAGRLSQVSRYIYLDVRDFIRSHYPEKEILNDKKFHQSSEERLQNFIDGLDALSRRYEFSFEKPCLIHDSSNSQASMYPFEIEHKLDGIYVPSYAMKSSDR